MSIPLHRFEVIEVPPATLGSVYQSDDFSTYIDNFNLHISYDSPAKLSCSFTPRKDLVEIPNVPMNVWLGSDSLGLYYINNVEYTFNKINITLFSSMQVLDFFPIINDNSEDGCFVFRKDAKISEILFGILSECNLLGLKPWYEITEAADFTIPSDKKYGNGESFLSILKDLSDFAGAVMVDDVYNGKVKIMLPTEAKEISYDRERLMNITTYFSNEFIYSQIFIKDTDGGLKRPVKSYQYHPFPYNKRALFYTYRGLLNDVNKAIEIATRIREALDIGDQTDIIEYAGLLKCVPFQKFSGKYILEVDVNYSGNPSPILTTTIKAVY